MGLPMPPPTSRVTNYALRQQRHEIDVDIPGNYWLDMNCNRMPSGSAPFLYGFICSPSHMHITVTAVMYLLAIVFSVIIKRKSARPGGLIYQYNKIKVHKSLTDRRRRLKDTLSDPVLVRDMEHRYGDLTSLRESVKQWELENFAPQKKDEDFCIMVGGGVVVPWIRSANMWLNLIFWTTFYWDFNGLTMMVLLMSFIHIIDNMILLKRAAMIALSRRGKDKKSESAGLIADVGVPVPDVEVGVPM